MVQSPAFCTCCFAIGRRDAYQSVDPEFRDWWAVDLSTVALVNGSYSDTSYLYPWLYLFYITKTSKQTKKEANIQTAKGAIHSEADNTIEYGTDIDGCGG